MFYTLVIYPLTQIIELVFTFCDKLFDNTGIAILGVSFAVSFLTLPVYVVAENWQQVERNKQNLMRSQIEKIKAVFHGNEQYMILSTYYRQQHYHPIMGLRSAFGLLIQIPFFTAAYSCLSNMSALQGHSFLFIRDMGKPDALFSIGIFDINILPIAMTLINIIASYIYTKGFTFKEKAYTYGLALLFVVILYNSPAGLVLYWTMNNVFSLVKNIFYKLKNPIKTLYYIACAAVTILIIWMIIARPVNFKQGIIIGGVFSLIYFAPFFVKVANHLIDKTFITLRDNFKLRLGLFLTSAIGTCLLIGYFIPSLLIASSPLDFCGIDDIANPIYFVNNTLFQAMGIFIVWTSLIFFLYHERMQTIISVALSFLFFTCLINVFFFKGDYGSISKLLVFTDVSTVDSSLKMILINGLVLLAIVFAICLVIKFKFTKKFNYIIGFACVGILSASIYNNHTITKTYEYYLTTDITASKIDPILHLSKTGKNVILLMLDRAENTFVEPFFEEDPSLYEAFSGFTLYKNTLSFNGHTLLAGSAIYGGYEYTPQEFNNRKDVKLVDKHNESLLMLPRLFTESANNFSAIVTDPPWENYMFRPNASLFMNTQSQEGKTIRTQKYPNITAHITDAKYTDIWYKEHKDISQISVTTQILERNILWYSMFTASPLALRPAFYDDGDYWSTNSSNVDFNDYINGYSVLEYLPRLTDTNATTENVFISMTNNTTHAGLVLQAPQYIPVNKIDDEAQKISKYPTSESYSSFAGAMKRLGEYFDYLKQNDLYDNTRIVIVADHGCSSYETDFCKQTDENENPIMDEKFNKIGPGHYHPLLMVKDFNDSGKLKINSEFMTNADTPLLLINGNSKDSIKLISDPKNPFTNKKLESQKENGVLVCTSDNYMPHHNTSSYIFTVKKDEWYRVKDNIFDSNNWVQEIKEDLK